MGKFKNDRLDRNNEIDKGLPPKASLSFSKGLLNSKAYNFLELDSNYGTKDSIMPLMIETIAKYDKGSLLEICNKNIENADFMELSSVLDLIKTVSYTHLRAHETDSYL